MNLHCDECIRKILKAIKKIEGNHCIVLLLNPSLQNGVIPCSVIIIDYGYLTRCISQI